MSPRFHSEDRRKFPRVSLQGELPARVFSKEIVPVDISATGVLLESPRPLAANAIKTLRIDLGPNRQFLIKGQVVRNYVHHFEKAGNELTVVKYRVAVEFVFDDEREQQELRAFIERLKQAKVKMKPEITKPAFPGPERRRVGRIEAMSGLSGQVAVFLDFQLLQLSAGGMMVKLAVPLPVASRHIFNLLIDNHELEVEGEVLECDPLPASRESISYRVIIQFCDLEPKPQAILKEFVEKQLGRQG